MTENQDDDGYEKGFVSNTTVNKFTVKIGNWNLDCVDDKQFPKHIHLGLRWNNSDNTSHGTLVSKKALFRIAIETGIIDAEALLQRRSARKSSEQSSSPSQGVREGLDQPENKPLTRWSKGFRRGFE